MGQRMRLLLMDASGMISAPGGECECDGRQGKLDLATLVSLPDSGIDCPLPDVHYHTHLAQPLWCCLAAIGQSVTDGHSRRQMLGATAVLLRIDWLYCLV